MGSWTSCTSRTPKDILTIKAPLEKACGDLNVRTVSGRMDLMDHGAKTRHLQKTTCWGEGGFLCHGCHDDSLTEWLDTQVKSMSCLAWSLALLLQRVEIRLVTRKKYLTFIQNQRCVWFTIANILPWCHVFSLWVACLKWSKYVGTKHLKHENLPT